MCSEGESAVISCQILDLRGGMVSGQRKGTPSVICITLEQDSMFSENSAKRTKEDDDKEDRALGHTSVDQRGLGWVVFFN